MKRLSIPVLTLILALDGCGSSGTPQAKQAPALQTVTVATVARHEVTGALTASGRLVPREEIAVAADVNGYRIADVRVEEGAFVRRGQILAMLDGSLLRSQIDQLRSALNQQQIAAEQARSQAARADVLGGRGFLSTEAVENRRFAVRSSQAAAATTRAQLNDLLVRQAHLAIRAPADGVVLERMARPGETSSGGATLFRIARGALIELYAELSETDAAQVHVGDPAEVTLPSGVKLGGTVRLIGARVDGKTGLVVARIALPASDALRQGGFAEVRFTRSFALVGVPEAAVRFDADGASVKVIGADDRVKSVRVRTGKRAQGFVELLQGPPEGSLVAVAGSAFALEGDKVRYTRTASK